MKRYMSYVVIAALAGLPLLTGCDEELSHEREVEVKNGKVKEHEETVKQKPDGTIVKEETKNERRE